MLSVLMTVMTGKGEKHIHVGKKEHILERNQYTQNSQIRGGKRHDRNLEIYSIMVSSRFVYP